MKRPYLIIFLFLMIPFGAMAQNLHLIDSLKKELKVARGEKRFHLLNAVAWEHRWAFPDSTIKFANEAFKLGQSLHLKKTLPQPLNYIGVANTYKGDRLTAFVYYDSALRLATTYRDSLQIGHSHNNLGRLFFEQGLLSKAYDNFISALAIFSATKNQSGLAYTYQSLANLYKTQKDFPKAESHYLKAYHIRLALHNTRDVMSALVQLGRLYQEMNEHDKGLIYFHLADSAGLVIQDAINRAEIKTLIAESYLKKGLLPEAEAMCAEGMNYILRSNNLRLVPQAYLTMGQIYLAKNDMAKAKQYFSMTLDVAQRSLDLSSKMEAHYFLWIVSQREKNKSEELTNYNQYLVLKDSLKDLNLARQVERLQFEIEIERKQQENLILKANGSRDTAIIQQQKIQNIALIGGMVFLSLLFFVQWRNSKKRKLISDTLKLQNEEIEKQRSEIVQQNDKLSKRNLQLSELNYEKDTLMSIVAHDLKSPLNRIKGLTDLLEIEGGLSPDQQTYLEMAKDATVAGLDLITDLLDVHMLEENVEPQYSYFDISKFLSEKIDSFTQEADAKKIHLHISAVQNDEVYLDRDYLGRIADNLISNAIKFSRPDSTVDISAGRSADSLWISVKDEGLGFSEKDKESMFQKFKKLSARPTAGESSNGLGLAIVKILVDRLKGEIDLRSDQGKGSSFTIRFPQSWGNDR